VELRSNTTFGRCSAVRFFAVGDCGTVSVRVPLPFSVPNHLVGAPVWVHLNSGEYVLAQLSDVAKPGGDDDIATDDENSEPNLSDVDDAGSVQTDLDSHATKSLIGDNSAPSMAGSALQQFEETVGKPSDARADATSSDTPILRGCWAESDSNEVQTPAHITSEIPVKATTEARTPAEQEAAIEVAREAMQLALRQDFKTKDIVVAAAAHRVQDEAKTSLPCGAAPIVPPPKVPEPPKSAPPTRTVTDDIPRPPHDPSKLIPAPPPLAPSFRPVLDFCGPADPNQLGPWAGPEGGAKANAMTELRFKEPKARSQDKINLLVPAWKSEQPPTGLPVSLGPNPKGQVADVPKPKYMAPPFLMGDPMLSEILNSSPGTPPKAPMDFQLVGDAVQILGIDAGFDFEGCTGSLAIAAEQRQIVERICPQAIDFPQITISAARSIITVLDVAKLEVPSATEGPIHLRICALARQEIIRETADTIVQANSVVRISEEAMASTVAAKGLPEAEHVIPTGLADHRRKGLPKQTSAEVLAKAADLKSAAERAGISGADTWADDRGLAKKQKITGSSSSEAKADATLNPSRDLRLETNPDLQNRVDKFSSEAKAAASSSSSSFQPKDDLAKQLSDKIQMLIQTYCLLCLASVVTRLGLPRLHAALFAIQILGILGRTRSASLLPCECCGQNS
jgi:hypothetical protein